MGTVETLYSFYASSILATSAVCLFAAGFSFLNRKGNESSLAYSFMMLGAAAWNLPIVPFLRGETVEGKIFWSQIEYLGIVTVPSAFFYFACLQTGRSLWLTKPNVALIFGSGLAILLSAWTNRWHDLIWISATLYPKVGIYSGWKANYGPVFWFMNIWAYILLGLGTVLLLHNLVFRSNQTVFRKQGLAMLFSVLLPMIANLVYNFGFSPLPGVEMVPLAFGVSGILQAYGLFGLRFLDLVPVARDVVFESMSDSVVVLDRANRIVDLNMAAVATIAEGRPRSELIGKSIWTILPDRVRKRGARLMDPSVMNASEDVEFPLLDGTTRVFHIRITPLVDATRAEAEPGLPKGRLVVLRDVTVFKQQEADLIKARIAADQANAAKSAFLAVVRLVL